MSKLIFFIINEIVKLTEILAQLVVIFCRCSLYATAGTFGVIVINYYFIMKRLPFDKLNLEADPLANLLMFWQSKGYDLSITLMYGIAVYIWASFAMILMCYYLGNLITTSRKKNKAEALVKNYCTTSSNGRFFSQRDIHGHFQQQKE